MFDPKKLNIRSRIIYTYGIIFHIHVKNQQTPDNFKDTYESKQISALKVSQIKNLPLPTRQMIAALSLKIPQSKQIPLLCVICFPDKSYLTFALIDLDMIQPTFVSKITMILMSMFIRSQSINSALPKRGFCFCIIDTALFPCLVNNCTLFLSTSTHWHHIWE